MTSLVNCKNFPLLFNVKSMGSRLIDLTLGSHFIEKSRFALKTTIWELD